MSKEPEATLMPPAPEPVHHEIVERLRGVLDHFVGQMQQTFLEKAGAIEGSDPPSALELRKAAESYRSQADDVLELIKKGEFDHADANRVAGTLYLTNLTLRWVLEQQTSTFRKLMSTPSPKLALEIRKAQEWIDQGEEQIGFERLLNLVEQNRSHYPLLMTMGFFYLRNKRNLTYAMRYFEKAVQTPTLFEPDHYRDLAMNFLAACHEAKRAFVNALNIYLRVESRTDPDAPILYDIARVYGELGNEKKSIDYFNRAIRKRPEFFAMGLVDGSFSAIREPIEESIKQNNEIFGELGKEFTKLIAELLGYAKYLPENISNENLREHIALTRHSLTLVKEGYYSGSRQGIADFFHGPFPVIIQELRDELKRRALQMEDDIHHYNDRLKEIYQTRRKTRPVFTGVVAGVFLSAVGWGGLALANLSLPVVTILLGAVAAGAGWYYSATNLDSWYQANLKDDFSVSELSTSAYRVSGMEGKLRIFWEKKVRVHVEAAEKSESLESMKDEASVQDQTV